MKALLLATILVSNNGFIYPQTTPAVEESMERCEAVAKEVRRLGLDSGRVIHTQCIPQRDIKEYKSPKGSK